MFCFALFLNCLSDFWYLKESNCSLFVSVVIAIVYNACFLFKVINYVLWCFSIMPFFAKHINQIFYFCHQIFFRTDFGSFFKYAGNCARGYKRMWLNLWVRADLQWTSNSYLPLLFFNIFMSKKFKHFSSFSSSIVN